MNCSHCRRLTHIDINILAVCLRLHYRWQLFAISLSQAVCVRVIEHLYGDRLPPCRWTRRSPYHRKLRLLHSRPLGHVVTSTTCSWSLNAKKTCNVITKQLRIFFFSVCNVIAILFLQWLSRAQLSWHIECIESTSLWNCHTDLFSQLNLVGFHHNENNS